VQKRPHLVRLEALELLIERIAAQIEEGVVVELLGRLAVGEEGRSVAQQEIESREVSRRRERAPEALSPFQSARLRLPAATRLGLGTLISTEPVAASRPASRCMDSGNPGQSVDTSNSLRGARGAAGPVRALLGG